MINSVEINKSNMDSIDYANSLFSLQLLNEVYNMDSEPESSTPEHNTPMDLYHENL